MSQPAKSANSVTGLPVPAGSLPVLAAIALSGAALVYIFRDGLVFMVANWGRDEYSHGYLIPVLALLMAWQSWPEIARRRDASGAWAGAAVVVLGLAVYLMGELGTLYVLIQYAFLITLTGVVIAVLGWRALGRLWVPLVYLGFMIPLPQFLYNGLSTKLQLISSELGVAVIKLAGISVLLEGNVIDLGVYKLQVAEACSGLRYLFPLMSFGFLVAYLYRGPVWQKAVLFLSTLPITVLMNSLRIGVIGVLVEYYGIEQAMGFLHDFEGWVIFMACVAILFLETWLLIRLTGRKGRLSAFFRLDFPRIGSRIGPQAYGGRGALAGIAPSLTVLALLVAATFGSAFIVKRAEAQVSREAFFGFPLQIRDWRGAKSGLPEEIVRSLQVDDYLIANYARKTDRQPVNFYVAFYDSQRKGQSVHSPDSCIPGDGWEIVGLRTETVADVRGPGRPLAVNRVVIAKGGERHLVYYWFPQRGRELTNEYLVKWYIFWDALTRNRTDGALVRFVTPIEGNDVAAADARLSAFLRLVYPKLERHIPG